MTYHDATRIANGVFWLGIALLGAALLALLGTVIHDKTRPPGITRYA